jgi:hypothetical protein
MDLWQPHPWQKAAGVGEYDLGVLGHLGPARYRSPPLGVAQRGIVAEDELPSHRGVVALCNRRVA